LEKNNVKVTFFIVGKNANSFPEIIKQIDEARHEI
jgi:peptidoglycan/xylan/chitin deacetylase (PgdA/CDA1 family)